MLVKVCGITTVDDAQSARDTGADWIGLNLVADPRRIDLETVVRIVHRLDDFSRAVLLVRLDQGHLSDLSIDRLHTLGVRRLQLYGDGIPKGIKQLRADGLGCVAVQQVADEASLDAVELLLCGLLRGRPERHPAGRSRHGPVGWHWTAGELGRDCVCPCGRSV